MFSFFLGVMIEFTNMSLVSLQYITDIVAIANTTTYAIFIIIGIFISMEYTKIIKSLRHVMYLNRTAGSRACCLREREVELCLA